MKKRPKPIPPKKVREEKPDWENLEWLDWITDIEARKKKFKGPTKEALKSLAKKH